MNINLKETINKGAQFLAREQQKDGSFMCLVSTKLDDYKNAKIVPAIVPTNIVLSSLIHIKEDVVAEEIKKKATDFLLREKSEYWSFNYWFRKSDWYKKEPYPDDLDDTFCALAALYEYQQELFDGKVMAKIVTMLTSAEKQEGGPYDMWLVPPKGRKTWDDTDLVVNSNVAFFLSLQAIFLPKVTAFIEKSIDEKDYEFPYNKIYPAIYFISRFYKGKKMKQMIDLLLKNQGPDGKWENPLRTALAISAFINFSGSRFLRKLEKGIEYLQKTQAQNGSWSPYSFYFQMRTKQKTLYAGSSTITTALCLEAIHKFEKIKSQNVKTDFLTNKQNQKIKNNEIKKQIYQKIVRKVKNRFVLCGSDLKKETEKVIAKTLKGDTDEQIVLLSYFFKLSLGESAKNISDDVIVKLGAANVFGWMAYTIYDDFLDKEGNPKLLSIANVCLRESSEIFSFVLPYETGFANFSKKIFDTIDNANMWEVSHCRNVDILPDYGNYSQLAEKSLGHILGPMAILFVLGYKDNSFEIENTMKFFRHYIIARQLNDDAHDWEDDLKRGQINAVGITILKESKHKNHTIEELKSIFWEKTIVGLCKDIFLHTKLARKQIKKISIIKNTALFEKIISSIEGSAKKAIKERDQTLKFIHAYKPG